MTLKSLAHPNWPYAGTAHAWRGFVLDLKGSEPVRVTLRRWELEAAEAAFEPVANINLEPGAVNVVYQKQNFGPDLP